MEQIDVDYLVVGAGASGLGFIDTLMTADKDVDFLLVDRRHRPGGHWLDAYPFVRLHQPSAVYGVASRRLGDDRIDESGPNAGFYERATAAAICEYFGRVLDEQMVRSSRVRFLGMHDYRGADGTGHHISSKANGRETTVKVRRRFVDATYIESEIPARHRPSYSIEPGVRVIPPNELVDVDQASCFTIIGAGKTAMDTTCWLLDEGVDPDRIRWIRPSDPWIFDRACFQPLELVASTMWMQARWVEAAAEAEDGSDFARRLEAHDIFMRIDPDTEPEAWRGAIVSRSELHALRRIERVEKGRVVGIGSGRIALDTGDIPAAPDALYVDCTAAGVRTTAARPIFEPDRICLQHVTVGSAPLSAATLGMVESLAVDDAEKNRLCPVVTYSGRAADLLHVAYQGMAGAGARSSISELAGWHDACRLNPASAVRARRGDPDVAAAVRLLVAGMGKALGKRARPDGL